MLAAVIPTYPERLNTKHGPTTLRRALPGVRTTERFQWYLGNLWHRPATPNSAAPYMATGTARTEHLHARLNAHIRTTLHQFTTCSGWS